MIAQGRRVLITGGAGAIGVVAARALVDAGASVVVNDVLAPQQAVAQIADRRVSYVQGNGSTQAGAGRLVSEAEDCVGGLTDAVLLAGIVRPGGLLEQTEADLDDTFTVNVKAAMLTAQALARNWRLRGEPGNLVFVSSWVQDVPWPGISAYSASKAALRSVARSFAREFAADGIRSNVLAPGIVGVGMARHQWDTDEEYRRRAARAIPMGTLQTPQSVADALLFLCSPLASYMTGATLLVDGGASLYPMDPQESSLD